MGMSKRCDGHMFDCRGNEDEFYCGGTCPEGEVFQCHLTGLCFYYDAVCNGHEDRGGPDTSDELGCDTPLCHPEVPKFYCESGWISMSRHTTCIPMVLRCDGKFDCHDHEDEADCECDGEDEGKCLAF